MLWNRNNRKKPQRIEQTITIFTLTGNKEVRTLQLHREVQKQHTFVAHKNYSAECNDCLGFVKIILLKSGSCVLALRKRRFCDAKEPLLPCKTYAFGMQNNRFCNVLITRLLGSSCACDNSLHFYASLSVYKTSSESK